MARRHHLYAALGLAAVLGLGQATPIHAQDAPGAASALGAGAAPPISAGPIENSATLDMSPQNTVLIDQGPTAPTNATSPLPLGWVLPTYADGGWDPAVELTCDPATADPDLGRAWPLPSAYSGDQPATEFYAGRFSFDLSDTAKNFVGSLLTVGNAGALTGLWVNGLPLTGGKGLFTVPQEGIAQIPVGQYLVPGANVLAFQLAPANPTGPNPCAGIFLRLKAVVNMPVPAASPTPGGNGGAPPSGGSGGVDTPPPGGGGGVGATYGSVGYHASTKGRASAKKGHGSAGRPSASAHSRKTAPSRSPRPATPAAAAPPYQLMLVSTIIPRQHGRGWPGPGRPSYPLHPHR